MKINSLIYLSPTLTAMNVIHNFNNYIQLFFLKLCRVLPKDYPSQTLEPD